MSEETDWESLLSDVTCDVCDEPMADCVCDVDIDDGDYDKHALDEEELKD
jgi:hypothetical protein